MAKRRRIPTRDKRTGRFLPKAKTARRKAKPKQRRRALTLAQARGRARRNPRVKEIPIRQVEALEADVVDKFTLGATLDALAYICFEKADHLEHNWQDKASAAPWRRIGKRVGTLAAATYGEGL